MERVVIIDDFAKNDLISNLGTKWRGVSDQVMGGISEPSVTYARIEGRFCLRLSGDVRLENNGGFIQAGLDLAVPGQVFDASSFSGIEILVRGNDEEYSLRLRTTELDRPQQSYRHSFIATPEWRTLQLAFEDFIPHRTEVPLNLSKLRRVGLVAIGRAFHADLAVGQIALY